MPRSMWYAAAAGLALAGAVGDRGRRRPDRPDAVAGSSGAVGVADSRSRHRVLPRPRARDPRSARDFTQLAGLYLQRARETADNEDLVRAEETARHSLSLRRGGTTRPPACWPRASWGSTGSPRRSRSAWTCSRRTRPRSRRAASWPRPSSSSDATTRPGGSSGMLATIRATWAWRRDWRGGPSCAGRPEEARRLLRQARDAARRRHGMPREQVAWFHLRLGRPGAPGRAARRGGARARGRPRDPSRATTACSAPWRGSHAVAARLAPRGRRAASSPSPGRSTPPRSGCCTTPRPRWATRAKAEEYYRAMAVAVLRQPGPYPPRVEPLPARPRPGGAARARQRRGGAPHPAGHLRLRPARLGAAQVGQGRRGQGADGAGALARHARRDAVLSTPA